jgi:hypothetical protein
MELQVAPLTLESLDAADVEAAALFIVDEDRPLRGLAGLCDWRMYGSLSRALAGSWYQGKLGDTLLVPSQVGRRAMRVFVFGLGSSAALRGTATMAEVLPRAFQTLRKAGITSCCHSLPWPGTELESALELWASHADEGPGQQLLLGDAKQILRWAATASSRFPTLHLGEKDAGPAVLRDTVGDGRISRVGRDRSDP